MKKPPVTKTPAKKRPVTNPPVKKSIIHNEWPCRSPILLVIGRPDGSNLET